MALFNWLSGSAPAEIPDIYPFPFRDKDFIGTDVTALYTKILSEVLERTHGIPEEFVPLLWDNCLASEVQEGLVTLLSKAMLDKAKLFLVHDKGTKVIRKATQTEEREISQAYKDGKWEKAKGVYITFEKYDRTDMIKMYSGMEYCTIASLWKTMNLAKAVQIKINDMRAGTSLSDAADIKKQLEAIAKALKEGKDVGMDAKDMIETAKPDLTATQSAETFINQKLSKYTGMPATWFTGTSSKGLGDSGTGDAKQVERGLKGYYFPIIKPVVEQLFGKKTEFRSEDFEQLSTSLEALEVFDRTSDEHLSKENKTKTVNKLFGLPADSKGDEPKEPIVPPVDPNAPPVPGAQPPKPGQPAPGAKPPPAV